MKKKVLALTNLYPSMVMPRNGIFIEHRLRSLLETGGVKIKTVSPVPYFPLKTKRFEQYSKFSQAPKAEVRHGIEVTYPRYPVIPKIGMNLAPFLYASALIRPLTNLIQNGYDFDVIDTYYFYPDGVAAALLGFYFKKPVIITALGSDLNIIATYPLPRRMIQWAARNVAGTTTVCTALADRLVNLGVDKGKIQTILHGVDQELFKPPEDRADLRKRLALNTTTLLSVGNLIELKGHHIAIQALTSLPDIELLIAGQGKEENKLRAQARSLGVVDRVRFLGLVNQEDLCDYYGASDILVLASSNEGIPNVLLESMACGTPTIATSVGGIPEVITSPETGLLMEERTPEALVQAVRTVLANYPDRKNTRRQIEKFSWKNTAEEHLELINSILK